MARLFTTGFETGGFEWNGANTTESLSPVITASYKRTGSYSCALRAIGSSRPGYFRQVFDDNQTEIYGRMALYADDNASSLTSARVLELRDANNALQAYLLYDVGTTTLNWYGGGGAVLALGNILFPADTWIVLEFYVLIGASGELTTKINGTTDATYSGDTDYTNLENLRSLYFINRPLINIATSTYFYLDDIAINDTVGDYENSWIGLGGTFWLKPTADGTTNDWTPSAGSDNYAMVDEVPPNTTDYVQALDAADLDLYALQDCPDYIARVRLVQVMYRAALVTSGSNDLRDVVRTGGANFEGDTYTVVPIIPSFTLYKGLTHYINPDTEAEWEVAEVDALEAGFEIVA